MLPDEVREAVESEAFGAMNHALCDFAMRWEIDGDYMRCRKCNVPQITNYVGVNFMHARGCKADGKVEPRPWETFVKLLAPITAHLDSSRD